MALHKAYPKSGSTCKVTFELPAEAALGAKTVALVGEFNGWSRGANMMKKNADGSFSITLSLKQHCEYQFRYLIDGELWENDWCADKYARSGYGDCENSVVIV